MNNLFLLQDRLQKIRQIINKYGEENFYLSFSGGKDSTVLSALVDMAIPDNKIPRVYANTGIEYRLILEFVEREREREHAWELVILKPTVPIKPMLEKEGYPFKSKEHSHILDIYSRKGMDCVTVPRYLGECEGYGNRYRCPKCLEYQFSPDFKLKVSDKCCTRMKEEPLDNWAKENKKTCRILGIMQSEGGRRQTTKCLAFKDNGKFLSFHPLAPMNKDWEDWFIDEYSIEVSEIYKPPYNRERTGCKGCPFAIDLQEELEMLEKFFPEERKQCEIIWKPVYDEYRRLNYRLKQNKQMSINDYFLGDGNEQVNNQQ